MNNPITNFTIENFIKLYQAYFPGSDGDAIAVFLAALISHFNNSNVPVFLALLGETGAGKTTLVKHLQHPDFLVISDLDKQSLLASSNYVLTKSRMAMVFKDFSQNILRSKENAKKLLATFAELHDGFYSQKRAGQDIKTWEGKFTVILVGTSIVEDIDEEVSMAGRRFLYIRMTPKDNKTARDKLISQLYDDKKIEPRVENAMFQLLQKYSGRIIPNSLSETESEQLLTLCNMVSFLRGAVKKGVVGKTVLTEDSGRLFQQMVQIVNILKADKFPHVKRIIKKLVKDNINEGRFALINFLHQNGATPINQLISVALRQGYYSRKSFVTALSDLELLKIVERVAQTQSDEDLIVLNPSLIKYLNYYNSY